MNDGPVVVVMLTHRDPPLVNRIVHRILQGRDTAVVVHHDPRGPELDLPHSSQIMRVPKPVEASWGRIGQARAVLDSLEYAAAVVPELSWVLVVSGQDYPCRPMISIEDELHDSAYDASLRWFPVGDPEDDTVTWQARTRDRYFHRMRVPGTRRHVPFPRRPPFDESVGLFIADTWVNLAPPALEQLRSQRARLPHVERYLARCQSPDEALLPTLLLNDADDLRIRNDRKRYIRWRSGEPHPETLTLDDLDDIRASGDFFARKVDGSRSAGLLDRLDALSDRV